MNYHKLNLTNFLMSFSLATNTVLIAMLNKLDDFDLLKTKHWYRIPVKSAPPIVREGKMEIIAFYQTSVFGSHKFRVEYFAKVTKVSIVARAELFPDEALDSAKARNTYFKVEFDILEKLPSPIISRRGHRLVFIPTTIAKFFYAKDFNEIFNDSPLEDFMHDLLKKNGIPSERQWEVRLADGRRYLDFSIFCRNQNVAIECDGDRYHDGADKFHSDKHRDNQLQSHGWDVLRFSTNKLLYETPETLQILFKTINRHGGYENPNIVGPKYLLAGGVYQPPTLFD